MRDYFTYKQDYEKERRQKILMTIGMIILTIATLVTSIAGCVIDAANAHKTEGNGGIILRGIGREIEAETEDTFDYTVYYIVPQNPIKTPVTVLCTEEELEELAKLAYLEAGAQSDECIRHVIEVVFNQLNYGIWGSTLHEVIYAPNNYEPAYSIPYTDTTDNIREIVRDVYENGISIPPYIMFFRAWYFHQWVGAIPEFVCDGVYFSSSYWCR